MPEAGRNGLPPEWRWGGQSEAEVEHAKGRRGMANQQIGSYLGERYLVGNVQVLCGLFNILPMDLHVFNLVHVLFGLCCSCK